jgi:hypothetical protein
MKSGNKIIGFLLLILSAFFNVAANGVESRVDARIHMNSHFEGNEPDQLEQRIRFAPVHAFEAFKPSRDALSVHLEEQAILPFVTEPHYRMSAEAVPTTVCYGFLFLLYLY